MSNKLKVLDVSQDGEVGGAVFYYEGSYDLR